MLNVKHRISSSLNPRSNGAAEAVVKRVSEGLKYYAENDLQIERCLPLIAMSLRATVHLGSNVLAYIFVYLVVVIRVDAADGREFVVSLIGQQPQLTNQ